MSEATQPAITWSTECAEVFAAYAKAQAGMKALHKGRTAEIKSNKGAGSSYSYSYAGLPESLDACLGTFNDAGLAVIQVPRTFNDGIDITTLVTHSSGQWILAAPFFLGVSGNDAQAQGSGITYARRYALQAMVGISPDDDDGGGASKSPPESMGRPRKSLRPTPPQDKPRCVGKAAPIAKAIRDATARLDGYKDRTKKQNYAQALRELHFLDEGQDVYPPEQLFVDAGKAVKVVLEKWAKDFEGAP